MRTGPADSALLTLPEIAVSGRDAGWNVRQAVIAADHAAYRYTATLGKKKADDAGLAQLAIAGDDHRLAAISKAIQSVHCHSSPSGFDVPNRRGSRSGGTGHRDK